MNNDIDAERVISSVSDEYRYIKSFTKNSSIASGKNSGILLRSAVKFTRRCEQAVDAMKSELQDRRDLSFEISEALSYARDEGQNERSIGVEFKTNDFMQALERNFAAGLLIGEIKTAFQELFAVKQNFKKIREGSGAILRAVEAVSLGAAASGIGVLTGSVGAIIVGGATTLLGAGVLGRSPTENLESAIDEALDNPVSTRVMVDSKNSTYTVPGPEFLKIALDVLELKLGGREKAEEKMALMDGMLTEAVMKGKPAVIFYNGIKLDIVSGKNTIFFAKRMGAVDRVLAEDNDGVFSLNAYLSQDLDVALEKLRSGDENTISRNMF